MDLYEAHLKLDQLQALVFQNHPLYTKTPPLLCSCMY